MELMSPAGSYAALIKAVEGGADAVYLGLPYFNARKPAKNFGISEITEAIEYAHSQNVKVYVTLNIDLKSSELKLLTKILILLSDISVDAIIIKDLALLYLVHKYFSGSSKKHIPIHISTQFGVTNSKTLIFLKKNFPLVERVVLAREINLEELKIIGQIEIDKIPEIEVFVQGSMCFSFSGKCLLSSFVGGKSANRGVCQAPCRVKYDISNSHTSSSSGTGTSLFSMKDLSLVNYIKELDECNITALKIEGRLKNPSWVKEITSIYRDTIDYFYSKEEKKSTFENQFQKREEKLKLYSGRELNNGFLFKHNNLTSDHNVHFGKKLGRILSIDLEINMIEVSFENKRDNSSLRFVDDNKFLGILHNTDFEKRSNIKINNDLINKLNIGTIVYEVVVSSVVDKEILSKPQKVVGINRYNLILELIESKNELKIIVETDDREIVIFEKFKKVVKIKRAVEPELLYDLLIDRHFNGWRIKEFSLNNKFLISKSQINNLVSTVSREIAIVNKDLNLKSIKILDEKLNNELVQTVSNIEKEGGNENLFNNLEISYSNANCLKFTGDDLESILFELDELEHFQKNKNKEFKSIIIDRFKFNNLIQLEKLLSKLNDIEFITISLFPIVFENEIHDLESLIREVEFITNKTDTKIHYEINDFGHLEILDIFEVSRDRILCGTGISVYNYFAINTLKDLGLSSFHIPLEIDKLALSDMLNYINNNSNNKMKIRMNIFSRIPLYYSRVKSDSFNSNSVYNDSIGTEMISKVFNDITIFESNEFYNISQVKFDKYLQVNELIVDLSYENNIIEKYLKIKDEKYNFPSDLSFNFGRKLF